MAVADDWRLVEAKTVIENNGWDREGGLTSEETCSTYFDGGNCEPVKFVQRVWEKFTHGPCQFMFASLRLFRLSATKLTYFNLVIDLNDKSHLLNVLIIVDDVTE